MSFGVSILTCNHSSLYSSHNNSSSVFHTSISSVIHWIFTRKNSHFSYPCSIMSSQNFQNMLANFSLLYFLSQVYFDMSWDLKCSTVEKRRIEVLLLWCAHYCCFLKHISCLGFFPLIKLQRGKKSGEMEYIYLSFMCIHRCCPLKAHCLTVHKPKISLQVFINTWVLRMSSSVHMF